MRPRRPQWLAADGRAGGDAGGSAAARHAGAAGRGPDGSRPQQVPTLETAEGGIFESNAIARYVARLAGSGLFGATPVEAVRA